MNFSVSMLGTRHLLDNLDRMPMSVRANLQAKMRIIAKKVEASVKHNLSGAKLNQKTGRLYNAVRTRVEEVDGRIEAEVYIEDVPYAAIQERGGTTKAHLILPMNFKVLRWYQAGKYMFATRVFHPGATIPASQYMKDAYRQNAAEVSRAVKNSVVQGIRDSMRSSGR